MATRRNPRQRPARPAARPKPPKTPRAGKAAGGPRVSGSVNVSPRFTLFGGGLLNLHFGGGGGRRGRRRGGGLIGRLTKVARRAYGEMTGHGSGPSPAGGKAGGRGGSFDDFRSLRPDLFDDGEGPDQESTDDQEDDDMPETSSPRPSRTWDGLAEAISDRAVEAADDSRVIAGQRRPGYVPSAGEDCDFCQGGHGHHWAGCPHRGGGGR
jgi:hypothetical protein